jgi:hypothetical protein
MSQSTDVTESDRQFASDVTRNLLARIRSNEHRSDLHTFLVTHAWVDGADIHLVYMAPPSDISWGLVRDTRESIVEPGPWNGLDEAVRYYYLLDLEEEWPGSFSRQPGDPDTIRWRGDLRPGLPESIADIPDDYRQSATAAESCPAKSPVDESAESEARRYMDPQ